MNYSIKISRPNNNIFFQNKTRNYETKVNFNCEKNSKFKRITVEQITSKAGIIFEIHENFRAARGSKIGSVPLVEFDRNGES